MSRAGLQPKIVPVGLAERVTQLPNVESAWNHKLQWGGGGYAGGFAQCQTFVVRVYEGEEDTELLSFK